MSYIPHFYSAQVAGTVLELAASGPQRLRSVVVLNTTGAVAYLQVFNKVAASVTIGTTTPTLSIGLPASSAMALSLPEEGWNVGGTGLSLAGTTARTGATGAAIDVNIGFGH